MWYLSLENNELIEKLRQEIGEESILSIVYPNKRQVFVEISHLRLIDAILFLTKNGFSHLSAITGSQTDNNLIEILYHLDKAGSLLTVRVILPEAECSIPTISDIIIGALLYEREIYEMYGVYFTGHPALNKLILPDGWKDKSFPLKNLKTTD